jgi:LPXTG-site transpeptidase (sortase) family protein
MRRHALVLLAALAAGSSAGVAVHTRTADAGGRPSSGASALQAPVAPAAPAVSTAPRPAPKPVRRTAPTRAASTNAGAPARLRVERLDLDTRIFAPAGLNRGPAWWPVTGRPGGGDTVAIAGHRTTHTRPFYVLERLRRGDRIQITYGGQRHTYRVVASRVMSASNLHIADAVGYERLLLTACTPRGSAAFRLVVEARPL